MYGRVAISLAVLLAGGPAVAEQLNADAAQRFVIGELFAFNCFEGTRGAGRVYSDGSVAGSVQFKGRGQVHYVALPAGTMRVKGGAVCAAVRGIPMEPCFSVNKTTSQSFRGAVAGLNFAYCDFTRSNPRASFVRRAVPKNPLPLHAAEVAAAPEPEVLP
jgi:hypothetical protein